MMELQKDINLIRKVSPFIDIRQGHKYIIQRNLNVLIAQVLKDATEFQSSNIAKLKALQQLKHICCVGDVQEHLTIIFKTLARILTSDDKYFDKEIYDVCYVIGVKIPSEFYLPTLINLAQFEDQQPHILANILKLIAETIQHESDQMDLTQIVHLLLQVETAQSDCFEVMDAVFQVCMRVIRISSSSLTVYARQLFQLILAIKSYSNLPPHYLEQIAQTLHQLAHKCGYSSVTDLHSNEVNVMLDSICSGESYRQWKHTSREFNKFKAIIQGCGEGIGKFMNQVIQIMNYCLHPEQEMELRMEVLLLLDSVVQIPSLQPTIKLFASLIFNKLIVPSTIWRVGKPNDKIRKAAVIIAIQLIDLLRSEEIDELFPTLIAPLKSCLTDDWAPDLRFASARLTTKIIQLCPILSYEMIRDFYPSLLERLDDSQNPIRIEICSAIKALFGAHNLTSTSISEYIIKAVLIHLDDSTEEVQKAVYYCLQSAQPRDVFIREAENIVGSFKYPRMCQELIKYMKELQHN